MRNHIALTLKRAGLVITDPTRSTAENYAASIDCIKLLVENLFTGVLLDIRDHQRHVINSQKSQKQRRKAKELGLLVKLKRGVNKSAAQ